MTASLYSRSKHFYYCLGPLALPLLIVLFFIPNHPIKDEIIFYPIIQDIGQTFIPRLDQIRNLQSPMGPIYFIFWGFIGKCVGFSLVAMRTLNIMLSAIVVALILRILQSNTQRSLLGTYVFLLNPYFIALVVPLLYTDVVALIFVMAGCYCYFLTGNRLIGSICFGMAICTRQLLIVVPAAAVIADLFWYRKNIFKNPAVILFDAIPFFMFGILFILWGGQVNSGAYPGNFYPENSISAFRFSLKTVNYSILLMGIHLAPVWIFRIKEILRSKYFKAAVLISFSLIPAFPKLINANTGFLTVPSAAGLLDQAIIKLGGIAYVLVPIFYVFSLAFLLHAFFNKNEPWYSLFSKVLILLFVLLESMHPYCWDKHYLLIVPFLFIICPDLKQHKKQVTYQPFSVCLVFLNS